MFLQSQNIFPASLLSRYGIAGLPVEVGYFIVAAAGMLILSLLAMVFLYIRRWQMNSLEEKKVDIKFKYQYFIYDALVREHNRDDVPSVELIINRFKQEELNSHLKKQIMTDLLIELKRSFKGTVATQFVQLYQGLGLEKHALAKLQKNDTVSKVQGIRELSELAPESTELHDTTASWQGTPNRYLADEARVAAIKAYAASMFSFLDEMQEPASEWLEVQLYHVLHNMQDDRRLVLAQWLSRENPYGLRLILRLISALKQRESAREVIHMLHHKDDQVKMEALSALRSMALHQACSQIFNLLDTENEQLKVAAVDCIGSMGHDYHARLLRPLLQSDSPTLREAALQAVSTITCRTEQQSQPNYSETTNR